MRGRAGGAARPTTRTPTTRPSSGSSPTSTPRTRSEAAEFRRFTEADLKAAKLDQASTVLSDLLEAAARCASTRSAADVWLRALTDVRLALGTRLGVEDETDIEAELDAAVGRNPTSPRVGQLSVYAYLTYLQESLVGALMTDCAGGLTRGTSQGANRGTGRDAPDAGRRDGTRLVA